MAGEGTLIGTGLGMGIGALAGGNAELGAKLGSSLGTLAEGFIAKKKADALTPPMEDTNRRNFLSDIERKRKQLQTGGTLYQLGSDELASGLANTQSNILSAGGGNIGALMSGLAGSSLAYNDAQNKLIAQNQQEEGRYTALANELSQELAKRRFDTTLQLRTEKMQEAAQATKSGLQNLNATLFGTPPQEKTNNPSADNAGQGVDVTDEDKAGRDMLWSGVNKLFKQNPKSDIAPNAQN